MAFRHIPFIRSIRTKVSVLATLVIIMMAVFVGLYVSQNVQKMILDDLYDRFEALGRTLAFNSEYALIFDDREALNRIAQGVLGEKDVNFAIIFNSKGEAVTELPPAFPEEILENFETLLALKGSSRFNQQWQQADQASRMTLAAFPVFSENLAEGDETELFEARGTGMAERVGHVVVGFSLDRITIQVEKLKQGVIKIAAVTCCCLIAFIVLVANFLVAILRQILFGMRRLERGDQNVRLNVQTGDELEEVARGFNRMAMELQRTTVSRDALVKQMIERKAVEQERRRLLRQNELILKSAGEGIYGLDSAGNTTFVNPAGARMLGYDIEELIDKPHHELIHHTRPSGRMYLRSECPICRGLKDGSTSTIDTEIFWRKDGSFFPVEYVTRPIMEHGKIMGAVITFRDITDRRRAQDKIEEARDAALDASRAKSDFLATMSHEIRTPMNAILGMADMLADADSPEETQTYLETLRRNSNNLLNLINDILDLSKVESGRMELEENPFDLHDALRLVKDMMMVRATEKNITLTEVIDTSVPQHVVGDVNRLRQVLVNLVSNALKFTRQGEITIKISRFEPESSSSDGRIGCLFMVKDTGIGIPKSRVESIFEAFTQADTSTTRKFGGTGLGLTISRRFIEKMGGKIWVESEEGVGTEFYFTAYFGIPAEGDADREEPGSAREEKPVEIPEKEDPAEDYRPMHILLAEDNADNQLLMKSFLRKRPYVLDCAVNGEEAVEMFKRGNYDLVFMDIHMPMMDGYEATRRIRAWELEQKQEGLRSRKNVPILALSASALLEDVNKSHAAGCDAHLTKPIRRDLVLQVIRKYEQQMEEGPSS